MNHHIKKFLPFIILIFFIIIIYFTNVHQELTLDNLRNKQVLLKNFVKEHPLLSPLIFIGIYIVSVCLVIPDSTILTLLSGLVFPLPLAIIYCIFAETIGAIIFFAIFRSAFGNTPPQKQRPLLNKMRKKFRDHAANYMLFLRLSHILPFWTINISAAYFKVSYKTFGWTTLLGVLPLTYILAEAGHNLSKLFAKNIHLSMRDIFDTEIKILLFLMGLLSLLPITLKYIIKYWKK